VIFESRKEAKSSESSSSSEGEESPNMHNSSAKLVKDDDLDPELVLSKTLNDDEKEIGGRLDF
jgi:hypothetical protein